MTFPCSSYGMKLKKNRAYPFLPCDRCPPPHRAQSHRPVPVCRLQPERGQTLRDRLPAACVCRRRRVGGLAPRPSPVEPCSPRLARRPPGVEKVRVQARYYVRMRNERYVDMNTKLTLATPPARAPSYRVTSSTHCK